MRIDRAAPTRATLAAVGIWSAAVDPTNGDDTGDGVRVGDTWINTATGNIWTCWDATAAAAKWRHQPRVLANSNSAVSAPADTNVNTLATYAMPANTMGLGGILEIESIWTSNNDASAKTLRVSFGGTNYTLQAQASQLHQFDRTVIRNRTLSSQIGRPGGAGAGGWGATTGALGTSAVDTTGAVNILLTAEKADASDTVTLEGYTIFLKRPDIT